MANRLRQTQNRMVTSAPVAALACLCMLMAPVAIAQPNKPSAPATAASVDNVVGPSVSGSAYTSSAGKYTPACYVNQDGYSTLEPCDYDQPCLTTSIGVYDTLYSTAKPSRNQAQVSVHVCASTHPDCGGNGDGCSPYGAGNSYLECPVPCYSACSTVDKAFSVSNQGQKGFSGSIEFSTTLDKACVGDSNSGDLLGKTVSTEASVACSTPYSYDTSCRYRYGGPSRYEYASTGTGCTAYNVPQITFDGQTNSYSYLQFGLAKYRSATKN